MLEPRRAKPQQRRRKSKCQCVMLCKGSRVVERLRRPLPAFCLEMVGYLMWWFVSGERLRRQSPFHLLLHPIEQFHNDRVLCCWSGEVEAKSIGRGAGLITDKYLPSLFTTTVSDATKTPKKAPT